MENMIFLKNYKEVSVEDIRGILEKETEKEKIKCVADGIHRKLVMGGTYCFEAEDCAQKVEYILPLVFPNELGSELFKKTYHCKYAYYAGAMANGISSADLVISLGKEGYLGSYGSGGQQIEKIERDIDRIQSELKKEGYLINLLCSMNSPETEMKMVQLFLEKGIKAIEASAYINMTKAIVYYRVKGLKTDGREVICENHVIAKISREEVAINFMSPPPEEIVKELLEEGYITKEQAELAEHVPMADDITVEADSGGHTDNRPLVSLIPAIMAIRTSIQEKYRYNQEVRIGAAGGIGTPESALAAFKMGADYIVSGSINQSCVEAGTSKLVKQLLGSVKMADVIMCPAADRFEQGGRVQVIKKGTLFPMNAQKLYDIYEKYPSIETIPKDVKDSIEKKIFKRSLEEVWDDTKVYMQKIDPQKLKRAEKNEHLKMALIFRWYVGQASKWAVNGEKSRCFDMQIWCGQSMGAFNNWVQGTALEDVANRKVANVAHHIMLGAAYLDFVNNAKAIGIELGVASNYDVRERK